MSEDQNVLKKRIQELESELSGKEAELAQTRLRLSSANVRLEKIIDEIAQELKMAGKIQKLLSPVELPHIQGFEFSSRFVPGFKFGGDYFDVFEHRDKLRFGIVLASSSGYAMSALFLSVLIRISSRLEAKAAMAPDEMLQLLAREMSPEMKAQDQASVFYGIVDRRTYEFHYASWGEVLAFHQKPGQDRLERLEPCGPALSKDSNTAPLTRTLNLQSKERLILCSEALAKARNAKGQIWGRDSIEEAIRSASRQGVHEIRNEILYRCESYTGQTEPERDQTVLVLEVKDKVLKLAKTE